MESKNKKFFETEAYKEEAKKWYGKDGLLEESGFLDIESEQDKKHNRIEKQIFTPIVERANYSEECFALLQSGQIKNKIDFFILEKHCAGNSNREISKLLLKEMQKNVHPTFAKRIKGLTADAINKRLKKILKLGNIKPINLQN